MRPLIHPQMMARLTPTHFPGRCTIQEDTGTLDALNQKISNWTPLAGHENIPCYIGRGGRATVGRALAEQRTVFETDTLAMLNGIFDSITKTMRAVVDGVAYSIAGIYVSSAAPMTAVSLERVET